MALYFLKADIFGLYPDQTDDSRNLRTLSIDSDHTIAGNTYNTALLSMDDNLDFVENGERSLPSRRLVLHFPTPEQADVFLEPVGTLRVNVSLMKQK